MTEFSELLEQLGLSTYSENFIDEGFDSWETLCDITESDLNDLHVKLGHRRKLQRAIYEYRQQHPQLVDLSSIAEHSRASGTPEVAVSPTGIDAEGEAAPGSTSVSRGRTKRKYRRRPKPDLHAPERPASAYVLFTNHVREELKDQTLTFAEIAKIVGERWQSLASDIRDQYEREAQSAKDRYLVAYATYKRSPQYEQYQRYLSDFKAKQASKASGSAKQPSRKVPPLLFLGDPPSKLKLERSVTSQSSSEPLDKKRSTYPQTSTFSHHESPSESHVSVNGQASSQPSPATSDTFTHRIPSPHRNEGYAPLAYDPVHRSNGVTKYSQSRWDSTTGSSASSSTYSHPVQFAHQPTTFDRRPHAYVPSLPRGQTWPERTGSTPAESRSPPNSGRFQNLLDGDTPPQQRSLPLPSFSHQTRSDPSMQRTYDTRVPPLPTSQSAPVPLERGEDRQMPNPRTTFSLAALLRAGEIASREEEPRNKADPKPP